MLTDKQFIEWEFDTFGYGYGNGEAYILPALHLFVTGLCAGQYFSYDYRDLENTFGNLAAWLLINVLCHADIIEYGTSPRFGHLTTSKGKLLREYLDSKPPDSLYGIVKSVDDPFGLCERTACVCDTAPRCTNPLF